MQSSNFLEVTINTQKLNDFLKEIKFLMKQQEEKIQAHHQKFTLANNSFNDKFERIQFQINQKHTKLLKSITSQALIQKDLVFKTQIRLTEHIDILTDRLKGVALNSTQTKQKLELVSQKADYVFEQSKQIKNIRMKNEQFQTNLKNLNSEIFKLVNQDKNEEKINQISQICQQTFFKILQNDRVRNLVKQGQFIRKKQPKKTSFSQNQAMFYASISQKLQKLQKQLINKDNQQINRTVYPTINSKIQKPNEQRQKIKLNPIFNNQVLQTISTQNGQLSVMSKQIKTKLESIQLIIRLKNENLTNELEQQRERNTVLNQKIQILTRKLQKQKGKIIDLASAFKRHTQRKIDEKMIDNFRFQMKKKSMDYEENLDSKLSKDIYEKQRTKLHDRLKIIHQNLIEKADKSEVVKAIKFIQQKIKQIIFLIAGSKDDDKEGAIKKKNFTCLSCDKELQSKLSLLSEGFKLKNCESTGTMMRSTTSRMRRHIRLASTNLTPQHMD